MLHATCTTGTLIDQYLVLISNVKTVDAFVQNIRIDLDRKSRPSFRQGYPTVLLNSMLQLAVMSYK